LFSFLNCGTTAYNGIKEDEKKRKKKVKEKKKMFLPLLPLLI
jgi:hypothetical protein